MTRDEVAVELDRRMRLVSEHVDETHRLGRWRVDGYVASVSCSSCSGAAAVRVRANEGTGWHALGSLGRPCNPKGRKA